MARPRPAATDSTDRKPRRALRPPSLSVYVLLQLLGPVAMLTLLLTSVIWLVTSLPLLDLVINRGQSAPTFLYLMLLELPTPLASSCLSPSFSPPCSPCSGLQRDSELVVMASAGYSLRQLAMPVLVAGADRDDADLCLPACIWRRSASGR